MPHTAVGLLTMFFSGPDIQISKFSNALESYSFIGFMFPRSRVGCNGIFIVEFVVKFGWLQQANAAYVGGPYIVAGHEATRSGASAPKLREAVTALDGENTQHNRDQLGASGPTVHKSA